MKDTDASKAKGSTNNSNSGNIQNNSNSDKKNLHIKELPNTGAVQLIVQQWAYGWFCRYSVHFSSQI